MYKWDILSLNNFFQKNEIEGLSMGFFKKILKNNYAYVIY